MSYGIRAAVRIFLFGKKVHGEREVMVASRQSGRPGSSFSSVGTRGVEVWAHCNLQRSSAAQEL